eukprot:4767643-Karenia_brevis.AAC.1
MQDYLGLSPEDSEGKRKNEREDAVVPEGRRKRTQEESDWYGESWTNEDKADREIGLVERYVIEDGVVKWIQEMKEAIEESE